MRNNNPRMGVRLCSSQAAGLSTEYGVVLIALLWIFIALTAIALSFARESRVEVVSVLNAQSLEKAYYVARAGVAETIYRIAYERFAQQTQQASLDAEPTPLELGRLTGEFGDGRFQVDIQDESGKVDLNNASEEQVLALLLAAEIPEHDAEIIKDSIMDWKDTDDFYRANGAESEYYESLDTPYSAKNNRINAIEELLLVRGVTPEYFYGSPERTGDGSVHYKYGISRYFTVYSSNSQININYAPLPVLLSIPGMAPELAMRIVETRRTTPFKNTAEISNLLPGTSTGTQQYLTIQPSNIYTLNVTASSGNSKVRRVIRTVVRLDNGLQNYHQTLYWNENVPDYESANL